jgi:hypothetical protein
MFEGGMSEACGSLGALTVSYHFEPKSKLHLTKSQILSEWNFTAISMGAVLITKFMPSLIAQQ